MTGFLLKEELEEAGSDAELIRATGPEARIGLSRRRIAKEKSGTWKEAYNGNTFSAGEQREQKRQPVSLL